MAKILVPLAEGFEELEAITIVDLLRRAGFEVITAGLESGPVTASRGTVVIPDTTLDQLQNEVFDLIVLPGGLPGANHLRNSSLLQDLLLKQHQRGGDLGAICAAPRALEVVGILNGRTVTCYPGALDDLDNDQITVTSKAIETDGNIVTSRGPGTAMDFALALIERLGGAKLRSQIADQLVRT